MVSELRIETRTFRIHSKIAKHSPATWRSICTEWGKTALCLVSVWSTTESVLCFILHLLFHRRSHGVSNRQLHITQTETNGPWAMRGWAAAGSTCCPRLQHQAPWVTPTDAVRRDAARARDHLRCAINVKRSLLKHHAMKAYGALNV
jgi:hypothetical protein